MSTKILFINADDKQRQMFTIYLENIYPQAKITEVKNLNSHQNLKELHLYELILYTPPPLPMTEEQNLHLYEFYQRVRQEATRVPFVLFSEHTVDHFPALHGFKAHNPKNGSLKISLSPAEFRKEILGLTNPALFGSNIAIPAFQRVRLVHFFRFNKVLCDIYLKLSDNKYVKVLNKETKYHKNDIDKFKRRGIDYFHIRNDDFEKFHVTFNNTPFLMMDTDGLEYEEVEEAMARTHLVMKDLITQLGFTDEVVAMTEKSVNEILRLSSDHKVLGDIIHTHRNRLDYIYDHSYLTSIVCCEILQNMRWANERAVNNLCMAALFHDMTQDNPEIAMATSQNDPVLEKYSPFEIKEFLNHPRAVAEMLNKVEFVPLEVKTIIQHHHENHEGTGFPQRLHPARLSIMVCTFIVAHDYVRSLYDIDFDITREYTIFEKMQKIYDQGNFKSPMESFLAVHTKLSHNKDRNWQGLDNPQIPTQSEEEA